MKKYFYIASVLFLFACTNEGGPVKVGEKTTLEVNETFDAGTIVKGEEIKAVFVVKNTGDHPLVFGEVRPSCSCTLASKPEKPIAPGKSTKIVAKVNTANAHSKSIVKSVTILTNTEPSTHVLMIKAKIK
ncbi:MAG: DUF1573 domain-containing protein [Flavobacteriia bacterium]|nr:DUF1573 domain-containing protein [Flavobacteriia bacterium]